MVAWHEITEEVWRILGRTGEPDCMGFGAERGKLIWELRWAEKEKLVKGNE